MPNDPRRYRPKVAKRLISFATRRTGGSVAMVTVFERVSGGWTYFNVQICED